MHASTIFWIALAFLVGFVAGVVSVAKAALWERKQAIEQLKRDGYIQACADMGINPLRLLREARQNVGQQPQP